MADLYADEEFSYPVVEALRVRGHDVLTAQEAGQGDQRIADEAVLSFATALGRATLTFNRRHFIRLHSRIAAHAGVIVCTRDDDVESLADRIHDAIGRVDRLEGRLLRITRPRA